MDVIFELILLCILVGGAYAGIKFGFIQIAAKPIKIAASISFAFMLCRGVGTEVIAPIIQAPVSNYIKDFMYTNCSNLSHNNLSSEVPTLLKMAGAAFNVYFNAMDALSSDTLLDNVILKLTSPTVRLIGIMIACVILLFVGRLLISLGIYLVNSFCQGGVIAIVNKSMGFVLAGLLSFLCAWAFVSVAEFFFHLPIFDDSAAIRDFDGGLLYRMLLSISPLELLLSF